MVYRLTRSITSLHLLYVYATRRSLKIPWIVRISIPLMIPLQRYYWTTGAISIFPLSRTTPTAVISTRGFLLRSEMVVSLGKGA